MKNDDAKNKNHSSVHHEKTGPCGKGQTTKNGNRTCD